jgi:hypothetical protein
MNSGPVFALQGKQQSVPPMPPGIVGGDILPILRFGETHRTPAEQAKLTVLKHY